MRARAIVLFFGTIAVTASIGFSCVGTIGGSLDADGLGPAREPKDRPVSPDCALVQARFEEMVWPKVVAKCARCHVPGGDSERTRFVLVSPKSAGALEKNFHVVTEAGARLREPDGRSLLLLKPTEQREHEGGRIIAPGSAEHRLFESFLAQATVAADCNLKPPSDVGLGVVLLDPVDTLRKLALQIGGRLPTEAEVKRVQSAGLDGLDEVIDKLSDEPAFRDWLMETFNDVLLTDAFAPEPGNNASLVEDFGRPYYEPRDKRLWWRKPGDGFYEGDSEDKTRSLRALAREPLELIAHVVKQRRPFTEIITGRYRLLNPYSARVYFGQDHYDAEHAALGFKAWGDYASDDERYLDFQEIARLPRAPYSMATMPYDGQQEFAGVLTTAAFMRRYPDTFTNRNRKRARYFMEYFLDFDILKAGQRIDLSQVDFTNKPVRNEPACTGCHAIVDPMAGLFQNWTSCYVSSGVYLPPTGRHCGRPNGWVPEDEMLPPALGAGAPPLQEPQQIARGLELLAEQTAKQAGFATAMTKHVLRGLTQRAVLSPPTDEGAAGREHLQLAYEAQTKAIDDWAKAFSDGNFELRKLIAAIARSPHYRAADADRAQRLELTGMGGGTLVTPEQLHRRLLAVIGHVWGERGAAAERSWIKQPSYLLGARGLRLFYGGLDSDEIVKRQRAPSGITVSIQETMALEMACRYVAADFAADKRVLFPHVRPDLVPSGNPQAADQAPILANLAYLHERVLGERLPLNDGELTATYRLLHQVQKEGEEAIAAGKAPARLPAACAGTTLWDTGATTTADGADPKYVIRAWQAVVAYLLMDYRFLYY